AGGDGGARPRSERRGARAGGEAGAGSGGATSAAEPAPPAAPRERLRALAAVHAQSAGSGAAADGRADHAGDGHRLELCGAVPELLGPGGLLCAAESRGARLRAGDDPDRAVGADLPLEGAAGDRVDQLGADAVVPGVGAAAV